MPGAPASIPGIINIRGDVESVLLIHAMLDLESAGITETSKVAITVDSKVNCKLHSGILLDKVVDVVDIPKSSISPPLNTLKESIKELVSGTVVYEGINVVVLDVVKLYGKAVA